MVTIHRLEWSPYNDYSGDNDHNLKIFIFTDHICDSVGVSSICSDHSSSVRVHHIQSEAITGHSQHRAVEGKRKGERGRVREGVRRREGWKERGKRERGREGGRKKKREGRREEELKREGGRKGERTSNLSLW